MSNKNLGIILLSGVLTFGAAPFAFSQLSPEKPQQSTKTQKTMPASQENIRKAQQALKDKGLYNGAVDGTTNPQFEAAVRDYQSQNQLKATGKLDSPTMSKLGLSTEKGSPSRSSGITTKEKVKDKNEPASPAKPAKKGGKQSSLNSYEETRQIQTALKGKGFDPGPIDGILGPRTHKAISDFQRSVNLSALGQMDEKTKELLGVGMSKSGEGPAREKPSDNTPLPHSNPAVPQTLHHPDSVEPDMQHHSFTMPEIPHPNLGLGTASSVEDIRMVQMTLKNRGYDPGEINGIVSSQTQDAVRRFQAANNLPVTGNLDDRTLAALGVSIQSTPKPDPVPFSDQSFNDYSTDLERNASSGRFAHNEMAVERSKPTTGPSSIETSSVQTQADRTTETTKKENHKDVDHSAKVEKDKSGKVDSDLRKRIVKSADVLSALTGAEDKRIPDAMLQKAEGIVVIPNMVKGAFGIGGRYGKGVAAKRLANGRWSAPAFVSIGGGSVGAQLGVSSTDLVLVFTDKDAFDALSKRMTLKLGADASVAAGPIGRSGEAGVTHDLKSGIYAYSRSKGLFAGIALDGAVIDMDESANRDMYGATVNVASIVNSSTMASNPNVRVFVDTLERVIVKKATER